MSRLIKLATEFHRQAGKISFTIATVHGVDGLSCVFERLSDYGQIYPLNHIIINIDEFNLIPDATCPLLAVSKTASLQKLTLRPIDSHSIY